MITHYRRLSEMCLENALNALKIDKRTPIMPKFYKFKPFFTLDIISSQSEIM